ncbi:MAG TPA: lysylphosphatidylglycerol synthase domain-containing protein [Candidatus Saccharimonadales bacterium]|jgi:uncharacterized membrane protein YbhN (UPF0104 family)|nr:lysylphosphatidylglycerol synthase domain-containing protein [Candidatus Saccharimonadales bacterium]
MKRHLRLVLSIVILLATIGAFVYYLSHHTYLLAQLAHTPPMLIVVLLVLYAIFFLALVLLMRASLDFFGKRMGTQENFLLSAYSSLVNFFGPGQSGPAVRGAYLKKRHGLRVKDYIFTTLLYYGFYAIISAFFLFVGSRPWWQTVGVIIVVGAASAVVIQKFAKKSRIGEQGVGLTPRHFINIFLATALQCVVQVAIYFAELHTINHHISLAQTITYTGAANFALFVALTPGAIGIRESFLLFTQHLHHIDSANIVSANLIDRAAYVLFLGLLFVIVLSLHAKDKLKLSQIKSTEEQA